MTCEQMCAFIAEGDSEELIPLLWERVKPLCFDITKMYYNKLFRRAAACGIEISDMRQVCYFAFLDALKSYNQGPREVRFKSFLRFPIIRELNKLLGLRGDKLKRNIPLNDAFRLDAPRSDEADSATLIDVIPDEAASEAFEEIDNKDQLRYVKETVRGAVERLAGNRKEVINSLFFENKTTDETAIFLNIGVQRVLKLRRKALDNLRDMDEIQQLHNAFYRNTGFAAFKRSGASAVELAAEQREEIIEKYENERIKRINNSLTWWIKTLHGSGRFKESYYEYTKA